MLDLLQNVRSLLELEIASGGPFLPLNSPQREDDLGTDSLPPATPSSPAAAPSSAAATRSSPAATPPLPTTMPAAERTRLELLIPEESPLHTLRTLAELEEYVATTPLIELDHVRTNPVFGVGDPEAGLMVIGEAPGAEEDLKGEPFVGRAGQLLDKILQATGFSRETVYIANILKSRPPQNRNPLADEVAAHAPILFKQISLIRPKMILSVGRVSACTLLGCQDSLGAMRGKLHDFHGIPLVVTYHPAALLRNPEWKRPTWEDMQFLRKHFDAMTAVA